MANLLVKNAVLNGKTTDILIENGVFAEIKPDITAPAGVPAIDAAGKFATPPFFNAHTHSPMTLLRGYADDLELFTWLQDYIWPAEAKMTEEDVLRGARIAMEEFIHSGTVFFNDMYWFGRAGFVAAAECGLRALISRFLIDGPDGEILPKCLQQAADLEAAYAAADDEVRSRVGISWGPHAVYTMSEKSLRYTAERAKATGDWIHVHASETAKELEDCLAAHGMTPIQYLDHCGLVTDKTVLAHSVHVTDGDIELIKKRGAVVSHNPITNYKLCSGRFPYDKFSKAGGKIAIGTDGVSSNNNLSMFDEMKLAALNAKILSGDPTCAPASEILYNATRGAALAFGIDSGIIAEGHLGDLLLLDPNRPFMRPCHHLDSTLVYAADTSCVDTMVCNGRVLMQNGVIAAH